MYVHGRRTRSYVRTWQAYTERLAEIENLDESDWEMYRGLLDRVETSVHLLTLYLLCTASGDLGTSPYCVPRSKCFPTYLLCSTTYNVQVSGLASTLASARDRSRERVWLRNAADGKSAFLGGLACRPVGPRLQPTT